MKYKIKKTGNGTTGIETEAFAIRTDKFITWNYDCLTGQFKDKPVSYFQIYDLSRNETVGKGTEE